MVFENPISPVVHNYEPFTMNQSMNLITWNGNESGDDLFVPTMYTSPTDTSSIHVSVYEYEYEYVH